MVVKRKEGKREYCAVIGDINKSRSLRQRAVIQRKFQEALHVLNAEFKGEIAAPFMITLGDEFQGLLYTPAASYRMVVRFSELMEPVSFSFGIGIGTLSTSFHKVSTSMDGEVFHAARHALQQSKKNKSFLTYEFKHPVIHLLNALVDLLEKQKSKLTPRQSMIARLMLTHDNQSRVASILGIRQPSVWKSLASSNMKEIHRAEVALTSYLARIGNK